MLSSRMRKASTSPSRRAPSGVAVPVHLPVHRVEDQRDDGQGDQRCDRHRSAKRVRNQARDPGDQYRPGQGDPICRVHGRLVTARAGGGKQRGRRQAGGQPGDPACDGETGRGGHDAEQGGGDEQPQDRRTQNRRQRVFVRRPSVFVRRLNLVLVRGLNRTHRASVPATTCRRFQRENGSAVTPVHRDRPRSCSAVAAGRLNYVSGRPV